VTTIDFRGYAYTRDLSAVSGALVTHYDSTKPQIWHIPFKDTVVPKITVRAPQAGYVVPAAYAALVADKLSLHGIRFTRIPAHEAGVPVEAFRATKVTYGKESFEGHVPITLEGAWKTDTREIPAGSLFVPIAQPAARLVLVLLDPQSPDSLAAWGFFSSAFEEKEYMEPYVAEKVAEEMLAQHPDVAREFQQRIAADPQFAASPGERLDFFYRLHPSHDERLNLYPVYRVDTAPPTGL